MRKFLIKIGLTSLPVLMVIVGVNYIGDPAGLNNPDFEHQLAKDILAGNNVTNLGDYDGRVFQREIISMMATTPDLVVLGSSRSAVIHEEVFDSLQVFNSSVTSGTVYDFAAIYQYYKEANITPSHWVVTIDPWAFNPLHASKQLETWNDIHPALLRFYPEGPTQRAPLLEKTHRALNFVSLSYFQEALKEVPEQLRSRQQSYTLTQKRQNRTTTKLTDGSTVSGTSVPRDRASVDAKAKKYSSGVIFGLADYQRPSGTLQDLFKELILAMQQDGAQVTLLIVPYHPIVYQQVETRYPVVLETEKWAQTFANKQEIRIYGSFDPNRLGIGKSSFIDGMHCDGDCLATILTNNLHR